MPELPEVETTRRRLLPLLQGKRLEALEHQDPRRYRRTEEAQGRIILDLKRRGKFLLLELEGGKELVVHLGMTGGFRLGPTPYTRAIFRLEASALYFHDPRRFGRILCVDQGDYREIPLLKAMGPEPLSEAFRFEAFYQGLRASLRPLKALLLDQRLVAGLGNIYADEALHRAGLHPARPGASLEEGEARRLYRTIREVLGEALALGGSTLGDRTYQQPDGKPGSFQARHRVYARAGLPCLSCGTPILRLRLAGRGTHFCPRCQPLNT